MVHSTMLLPKLIMSFMLLVMIVTIISDFFLALSVVSPTFRVGPVVWYSSLVIPKQVKPPSVSVVQHLQVPHPRLRPTRARSPLAFSAERAANATFIFHVFPGGGSGGVMELIETLKERYPNQVAHIEEMTRLSFPPVKQWSHWHRVRNLLLNVISTSPKPCIVFIESPLFVAINNPSVYFLTLLRDPLSRLQNHFQLDHWGDDLQNLMHPHWSKKAGSSFESCIIKQGKDCSYALARYFYSLWFCGFDRNPKCVNKGQNKVAFSLAQKNIENFLLVGIIEELHKFIVSLEQLVPTVFHGLEDLFLSEEFAEIHSRFEPKRNISLNEEIRLKIGNTLKEEYSVFDFAKKCFFKKFEQLTLFNTSEVAVER